ncbi:TetR family transcriptional regulator [Kribbella catacumbae]|uniref:acyl-CoA-like ligand-binding transcription factor n=1 Tax=Kribbella catacumbae TaxID=460086 RepID=UPI00036F882F|nr:TetR family transcriptional regulator [Kribbella catacumbae]
METAGLRERKKQETRIALSWAAVRLTVERGFDNVRVEDIAAEAGVSLRTFRNYFSSKAEAIAARHVERVLRVAGELRARPAEESLWEAIRAAIEGQFPLGEEGHGGKQKPDGQWLAGVQLMITEPALQGALAKANAAAGEELVAAIADRTKTQGLYPQLVAAVVGAATEAAMAEWLRADPPRSMQDLLAEALDRVEAGLPEPG